LENGTIDLAMLSKCWLEQEEREQQRNEGQARQRLENHWSVDILYDLYHRDTFDLVWEFILLTYPNCKSVGSLGMLAAGPMEELRVNAPDTLIPNIEKEWRMFERFRLLLSGVWAHDSNSKLSVKIAELQKLGPSIDDLDSDLPPMS
jgi:hypothetical protein